MISAASPSKCPYSHVSILLTILVVPMCGRRGFIVFQLQYQLRHAAKSRIRDVRIATQCGSHPQNSKCAPPHHPQRISRAVANCNLTTSLVSRSTALHAGLRRSMAQLLSGCLRCCTIVWTRNPEAQLRLQPCVPMCHRQRIITKRRPEPPPKQMCQGSQRCSSRRTSRREGWLRIAAITTAKSCRRAAGRCVEMGATWHDADGSMCA